MVHSHSNPPPHSPPRHRSQPAGHRLRRPVAASFAILAAAAVGGCGPPKADDLRHFLRSHEQLVAGSTYRAAPPDVIQIASAAAPEIDGETQTIRSDGKISLRLLGEVKVAGLTSEEMANKLERLLARYYTRPEVSVRVVAYRSKVIYVLGQVSGGGPVPFTGRDTLLGVLARARPNFLAWTSQTKVIRPSPDSNERRTLVVDVDRMVRHGDLSRNILLQEGDIVYVPPTPLAWAGLTLQKLLFPVAPAAQTIVAPAVVGGSAQVYANGANTVGVAGGGLPASGDF